MRNYFKISILLAASVLALSGCSSQTQQPSADIAKAFSHSSGPPNAQAASEALQQQQQNFARLHPDRVMANGQVTNLDAPPPNGAAIPQPPAGAIPADKGMPKAFQAPSSNN